MVEAMSGYQALHNSAAWFDISPRGRLQVRGEDRQRFIHAMCTNDVESLLPGQGTRGFFLDTQGHIQAHCRIFMAEDHLLLDCEPERQIVLANHLERFIIMDDVTLEDASAKLGGIAVEGPGAEATAQALGGRLPPAQALSHIRDGEMTVARSSLTGQPGLWYLLDPSRKAKLIDELADAGAVEASPEDVSTVRVENQIPLQGEDYPETAIPQQTQQMDVVSFTKGCYLGQEIVERVRARGKLQKLLVGLELEASTPPPAGSTVFLDGREVGRLTSPVFSPTMGKAIGFAILRREAASPGTSVRVDQCSARVRAASNTNNLGSSARS